MADGYRLDYLKRLSSDGNISESELLNIMLGNAFGGKDMSAVAAALLERFPTVLAVLKADTAEIISVEGVSEKLALYLKSVGGVLNVRGDKSLYINGSERCISVAQERFSGNKNEIVEIYMLNKSGKVTAIHTYTSHSPDRVNVSAAEIMSVISSSRAHGLYFAHSHVNCAASPSRADDEVTRSLIKVCDLCKKIFYDHCIVSSNGDKFSYLYSGRLDKLKSEVLGKGRP